MNRREFAEKVRDMVQDRITSLQEELDALNEALASPQEAKGPCYPPEGQLKFNEIRASIIKQDGGLDEVEVIFVLNGKPMCFFTQPLRDDETFVVPRVEGTIPVSFSSG